MTLPTVRQTMIKLQKITIQGMPKLSAIFLKGVELRSKYKAKIRLEVGAIKFTPVNGGLLLGLPCNSIIFCLRPNIN